MFEINGVYANRIGKYTVLAINGPKMHVRYEDGTEADLNINIQARIWENILVEREKIASRLSVRRGSQGQTTNHYIKSVSIFGDEESIPGWQERVVMITDPMLSTRIRSGDRLILYVVDTQTFYAVATITGDMTVTDPQDYFYRSELEQAPFFPIDIDAVALKLSDGVQLDAIELESLPDFRARLGKPEVIVAISEDDFELLAETLTEVSEDEDDDEIDEDLEVEEDE